MKKNIVNISDFNLVNSEEVTDKLSSSSKSSLKKGRKKIKAINKKISKETNMRWLFIQSTKNYRNLVALETCHRISESLKSELFEGETIVLSDRIKAKSEKNQKRIMRRIIEKRQAQATHHKLGRTTDLFIPNLEKGNISRCMYMFN